MAGNFEGAPVVKTGTVTINVGGSSITRNFSFDTTGRTATEMGYQHVSFTFLTVQSQAELVFTSTSGNTRFRPVIDNVTVIPCLLVLC